jgi:hypothetical protein
VGEFVVVSANLPGHPLGLYAIFLAVLVLLGYLEGLQVIYDTAICSSSVGVRELKDPPPPIEHCSSPSLSWGGAWVRVAFQVAILALEHTSAETFKASAPRAYATLCLATAGRGLNVQRFLVGRQFFVVFVVFLCAQLTTYPTLPRVKRVCHTYRRRSPV